ncbi:glycosyltransferase [Rhodohalobacter sp.]|uniref:glycosyltransferase n=1 Tax=Rhodohalobacter sp. TaxID=1974210 RepID=UPI002ACD8593|nr:glycosyltransferase [Rhodohalobacter sp.]MDZ7755179.1 glycosyltransferase [Rhodohalobacter sp.]
MKNTAPIVSICSLAYNHENFVRDCLEGFLMQETTFPVEIIIHDDASTDKTADIIREYSEKYPDLITAILQKENKYSQGIRPMSEYIFPKARGKYIALCEGDDYWTDPQKIQKQVGFMEKNPEVVLTYHTFKNVDVNKEIKDYREKPLPCTFMFINDLEDMPDPVNCPNGDRFLLTYFSLKGSLKYLENIKPSVRRVHEGGVMSMVSMEVKLDRQVKTWSAIYEAFKESKISEKLLIKKNTFIYRQLLWKWKNGDEGFLKIIFYPIKVRYLRLYKLLIRSLINSD